MNSVAASSETKSMPVSRPLAPHLADRSGQWVMTASLARPRTVAPSVADRSTRPSSIDDVDGGGDGGGGQRAAGKGGRVQQGIVVERCEHLGGGDHSRRPA